MEETDLKCKKNVAGIYRESDLVFKDILCGESASGAVPFAFCDYVYASYVLVES